VSYSGWFGRRFFLEYQCSDCSGIDGYRSRPRNFLEKWGLRMLLLRAVRCDHCYHRNYVFVTVRVPKRMPRQPQAPSTMNEPPRARVA